MAFNMEESRPETYYIPPNYEDAGGLFGGHFTQRNGIEMAAIGAPLVYINAKFIFPNVGIELGLIIAMLTIIPPVALCAFGIRGESITQILVAFVRYAKKKRKLSYLHFYDGTHIDTNKSSKQASDESITFEGSAEMESDDASTTHKGRTRKQRAPIQTHILNSAMKEILLRKLELGDDDDEED